MNDGQYTNLRNYLEEIASQGKQLLAEQKRTNELLERVVAPVPTFNTKHIDLDAIDPTQDAVYLSGGSKIERVSPPFTVETVKEEPLKTTETVEVVEDKPATATKKGK